MRQTFMQRPASLALCLLATAVALAQDPAPPFEVLASIKPAAPGQRARMMRPTPGGRLNINNMTLKDLIQFAFRVQPFQISGGPAWLDSENYDIVAKADHDPGQDQLPLMLQSLLADRFALKIHREMKDMPVYALVLAKSAGKETPGLTDAKEGGCAVRDPTAPIQPPTPGKPPTLYCGNMMMGINQLYAQAIPLGNIVPMLSRMLGRTVIDKTGVTGKFDIHLEWTPDPSQLQFLPPDAPKPNFDPSGPSIFTALQEQLGLKLESQKGPVEILIIDHAERPSEN